jgi:hypothetical protein
MSNGNFIDTSGGTNVIYLFSIYLFFRTVFTTVNLKSYW